MTNNVSGAGYYFPGEYGEQRNAASGRRSRRRFERIVEVTQTKARSQRKETIRVSAGRAERGALEEVDA